MFHPEVVTRKIKGAMMAAFTPKPFDWSKLARARKKRSKGKGKKGGSKGNAWTAYVGKKR